MSLQYENTMKKKLLLPLLVCSLHAGLVHAEGSYSSMDFSFLIYAIVALTVMGVQALIVLCSTAASISSRLLWVLGMLVLDVLTAAFLFTVAKAALETMFPYLLWVIPGFIALYAFRMQKRSQ